MRVLRYAWVVAAVLTLVIVLRPRRSPVADKPAPPAPVRAAEAPPGVEPAKEPPPQVAPRAPEVDREVEWKLTCRRGSIEVSADKTRVAYEFDTGKESERGDLTLYFDDDDCSGGAVFGCHDDNRIHPLGKKTGGELSQVRGLAKAVPGITPLDAGVEGTAFIVKRRDGTYALVRLTRVVASTFKKLRQGGAASIEFEWRPFTPLP